jgi:hypothetical protein
LEYKELRLMKCPDAVSGSDPVVEGDERKTRTDYPLDGGTVPGGDETD